MSLKLSGVSKRDEERIEGIMESHGFNELKETQVQAFENGVLDDKNHLLVAETGNGKTLCAEAVTKKYLDRNNAVAYLVPSTQLVRDKKETIQDWVDSSVEVATGSGKYHHGDVVVATFNSFYQAMLRGVGNARGFDVAVLDDFHELYGSFIGPGLEKSISAAKQHNIDIFAMSATIGNPEVISEWLDSELTISNETRSIPIQEEIATTNYSSKKKALTEFLSEKRGDKPFLVFNYAKSWAESRAESVSEAGIFDGPEINGEERLRELLDGSIPKSLQSLGDMIENGVAYHHSSLPRNVREWIEDLYQQKQLSCICATTTIAYGFDAPVRSVVVADMKRRGSWVGKWEYQQWIGRAARPGYGYDKGNAYVFTKDEYTVRDEFFEPRELEPIETHVDSPAEFRKLILELISMGWETPEELEEFIEQTLYWGQISTNGAWGRSFERKERRLKKRLRETADWLEFRGFIRENRTSESFDATDKGGASVEFLFDTNSSATLSQVNEFYEWVQEEGELEKLRLLGRVCDVFDLGLREDTSNQEVAAAIKDSGLPVNGNTITASVIHSYWNNNKDIETIEEDTGINATYLTSTAYRISSTFRATEQLIESARLEVPKWFSTYSYQVQRGARIDEVPFVQNVTGLGRSRVRSLREYFHSSAGITEEIEPNDAMWVALEKCLENSGSEDAFIDAIEENVGGIGTGIAARIVDFYNDNHVAQVFREPVEVEEDSSTTLGDFS